MLALNGFWVLFLLSSYGFIIAQSQQSTLGLSECATECISSQINASGCEPLNITCLCSSTEYQDTVEACLQDNCTIRESLAAKRYQATTCQTPVRDRSLLTRAVTWALFALAVVCVTGRCVFRFQSSGFGLDDFTILLALLILTPEVAMLADLTKRGLGRDIWMVEPDDITHDLYFYWAGEQLYIWVLCITKCSTLLLYLQIWTPADKGHEWFQRRCFVLIGLLVTYAGGFSISLGLQCYPTSYAWTHWDGEHQGHCLDVSAWVWGLGGANIGLDILVYTLPILMLARLSMPMRKKIGVGSLFLVGLFVTACSIVRLHYIGAYGSDPNFTWNYNNLTLWSGVETNLSVVCACLPSTAGLVQRFWKMTLRGGKFSYGTSEGTEATASRRRYPSVGPNSDFDEVQLSRLCVSPNTIDKVQDTSAV